MATSKYFDGKIRKQPGVYSQIKSGVQNLPQTSDFSRVLLIDTGTGAAYGGKSGINGDHDSGLDSIYTFTDLVSARNFWKGGIVWKSLEGLFKPNAGDPGISTLYVVRAATTTKATLTFEATGGGSAGGTFQFFTLDEGLNANGSLDTSNDDNLIKGYGYTVESGVVDTSKFIFKIWLGTYTGDYTDSLSYGEELKANSLPTLLAQSPEFNNIQELIDWAGSNSTFAENFVLDSSGSSVTGAGTVDSDDVTAVDGYNVATGGTETYGTTDLTDALEAVKDLDYTFILCDKYGSANYNSASVGAILSHIETDAKYEKYMFYGGGKDSTEFSQAGGSLAQAAYFDTSKAIVVHGDPLESSSVSPTGFRRWPTLYKAAIVLGRIAGLPPQVPGTFKGIGIDGEAHRLKDREKDQALDGGVLCTFFDADFNNFIILQAVNSLQTNNNIVNPDAQSHLISLERIKSQLNKDISINAKVQLLGQPFGVNRNTLSANYVKNWTETFLETKKATEAEDNLIIAYSDVVVTRVQDYYEVKYTFEGNTEITKIFITGTLID